MYIVDIDETNFRPLPPNDRGWSDPLVVYRRKGSKTDSLIVLVHGLGGRAHETWGNYPEFVLADLPGVDVGLLDYESGLRRRLGRSIKLRDHARAFSHSIRDIKYRYVFLVGHSMGGLLCKWAVKMLLDSGTRDSDGVAGVDKIAGLMLFATPQSGSRRVLSIMTWFSKDARVLRVGSELTQESVQCFQDRVVTTVDYRSPSSRQHIPTFAVIATGDRWVDALSAGLGLESDQQKVVTASHSSLVKPASQADDAYVWFKEKVDRSLQAARAGRLGMVSPSAAGIDIEALRRDILRDLLQAGLDVSMHTDIGISDLSQPSPDEEEPDPTAKDDPDAE